MFEKYNPLDNNMLQVIDNDGKIINKEFFPNLSDDQIVKAYRDMLFARTADLMIVSYQRQGRIFTYPPNYGQEAIAGAIGANLKDDDWLVPAFREMGAYLAKGATLKELFLYFMGYEDGSLFKNAKNIFPMSVPIASQLTHAVGVAYELKYNKKDNVVLTVVGDGGTSEGDFHEALNIAGVWKGPVVFVVQNNQYGISTPVSVQTASKNIAVKSIAYGIKGIKVDGNDYFAMYKAINESITIAKKENMPVLIEALTYRKGAHTTSDDPTKYRTKEEEESWEEKDPLLRLKKYLISNKLFTEKEEEKLISQYKKEIDRQFIEAENYPKYPLDDVFKYLYEDMPADLLIQKNNHEKFLKWKENFVKN
ncbi:MAG: pyruvate dehydrogenase (acetyl-transferring) E1 component subunit alpha [Bacteroidales bacterium]|nr:pyruvate dehydrogenase (acetyl-transferring) E1 component subunit alpha [Bacteroidales bacterium]MBN2758253.1 pyruvate dehydrogenase (acetyl-transferring) E1 component subunit alpha [Bacteroidales bacterium]